jgi:hypothetical protein
MTEVVIVLGRRRRKVVSDIPWWYRIVLLGFWPGVAALLYLYVSSRR